MKTKYRFYPEGHTYDGGSISVSTLIGKYQEQFDGEYWSKYKAWEEMLFPELNKDAKKEAFKAVRKEIGYGWNKMKNRDNSIFTLLEKKYPDLVNIVYNEIQDQITNQWQNKNDKANIKGTAYHEAQEREALSKGVDVNPFDGLEYKVFKPYRWEKGVKIQNIDLYNLEPGSYPEIIVAAKDIIGQVDRPFFAEGKKIYIRDFKTNEKIDTSNSFQKMKYPVNHLDDCKFNVYALQLSLYGYLFELHGYEVQKLALDHYNRSIEVPYLRKEVEDIVNHWRMQNMF